jgi:hypothetical protein
MLVGCGGMTPRSEREMESRIYKHRYELVHAAVLSNLASSGFPIVTDDPDQGLIETGWLVGKYRRSLVRAQIKPLSRNLTQVMLGIKLEEKGPLGGKWKPQSPKMTTYEDFFEAIDLQIYREYFNKIERKARHGDKSE